MDASRSDTPWLEPLYTADEMRAAEAGHDIELLKERAGRAVAEHVLAAFPDANRIVGVCGNGANGDDGRIALRVLRDAGREAEEAADLERADVVVDALFGTGFRGEPRPEAAALIARINASGKPVVAVDVPSGADASTGEVAAEAVRATATVTMHAPKVGLHVAPGRFHAGEIAVADIGLAQAATEHRVVTRDIVRSVPLRRSEDNKYSAGSVLVVGGSCGMTGAVCLAARAAFRADAGYVAVAAPADSLPVLETQLLEAVKRPLEEAVDAAARASALAIGPGLGRTPEAEAVVRRLLDETDLPVVLDADALHELDPGEWGARAVLTPHAGELARLLDVETTEVDAHRLAAVRRAADRFGCVVLLKGADTLVAAPRSGVWVRPVNTAALATAGTGDVLTGVVAAFLAKGLEPRVAAAAAATAHGIAASLVPEKAGMIASDLLTYLPKALSR